MKTFVAILGVIGSLAFLSIFFEKYLIGSVSSKGKSDEVTNNIHASNTTETIPISESTATISSWKAHNKYGQINLYPGELPGYTGWFRPGKTLAGYFKLISHKIDENDNYAMNVTCEHKECVPGRSKFYVRAYGPAIVTGLVREYKDGSYEILIPLSDPGDYTIEVVLTFSNVPDFADFPLQHADRDPDYEGYLLPGFPLIIHVPISTVKQKKRPERNIICTKDQLTENILEGALYKGQWKVKDSIRVAKERQERPISMDGYKIGINSLGIFTDYEFSDCRLLSNINRKGEKHLMDKCFENAANMERLHIIFIGDSVMFLEKDYFTNLVKSSKSDVKITQLSDQRGLAMTLENIQNQLQKIQKENPNETRVIYFNAGLHDISKYFRSYYSNWIYYFCLTILFVLQMFGLCLDDYCAYDTGVTRKKMKETKIWGDDFACIDKYQDFMIQFLDFLETYPTSLKVFRSSTAAWHRYGNFGFGWKKMNQPYTKTHHFVDKYNQIAYDILKKYPSVHILDGYWLTLPRPDNTEASKENKAGKHMAHPGLAVTDVLVRKWFTFLIRHLCSDIIDQSF